MSKRGLDLFFVSTKADRVVFASQTSAPVHHPQHIAAEADAHVGAAPAGADALLHAADADQEPVCDGRPGARRAAGVQDGEGKAFLNQLPH